MSKETILPTVVIVGRANVGKSTLFNRLSVDVKSITFNVAGVTRDFIKDIVSWQGKNFVLVDTGGISLQKSEDLIMEKVRQRALTLLRNADLVLFMVDGSVGIVTQDHAIAKEIHKLNKSVVLVINKADTSQAQDQRYEFERLGFKDTIFISAQHGTGIADLLETIVHKLPRTGTYQDQEPACKVVLLGRPNVGKSSLLNLLLHEERAIVADVPGTTREPISGTVQFYKESIQVTDTPGIRKKRAVEEPLEGLMVKSAMSALKDADIVLLLTDITEGRLTDQELKLAFYAFEQQHKALVVLFNKKDLADVEVDALLEAHEKRYKYFFKNINTLQISCKTGHNIGKILPLLEQVRVRYMQEFSQQELTLLFRKELAARPLYRLEQVLTIESAKQVAKAPITIVLYVKNKLLFGESQINYFENCMRAHFDLKSVPIKFFVRSADKNSSQNY